MVGSFGRWFDALVARESQPVDLASMAAFRVLFGVMASFGAIRFIAYGWVERFFVRPDFHFKFWGFGWVEVAPPWAMYGVFVGLAVLGLMIALGFFYRFSILAFFVLFTYVELLDVSNYLNHYYLVSVLAFLMCFMPLNRMWSIDARIWPRIRTERVARISLDVLRFQVACVYVFAGLAKFGSDWLLGAQPLNIWLTARVDTPVIGPLLDEWWLALAMSWAGFLFDTTIVFWLSIKRTRPWAYAVVLVFHGVTHVFFAIGLFPLIMIVCATVFFEPDWPRRFARGSAKARIAVERWGMKKVSRIAVLGFLAFATVQVALPLRHLAYPSNVIWSEEGMRWSWKVMVREKNGYVRYQVYLPEVDKTLEVAPSRYLSSDQEREFATQPDLIHQLAQRVGADWGAKGYEGVEVRADAWASLNGRRASRLIDPDVDLLSVEDDLMSATWIEPAPQTGPIKLGISNPK